MNPASVQPVEAADAVAARPILQEYDAFTVDVLGMHPAEFGNLAARHNHCGNDRSLSEGSGRWHNGEGFLDLAFDLAQPTFVPRTTTQYLILHMFCYVLSKGLVRGFSSRIRHNGSSNANDDTKTIRECVFG